MRAFLGTHAGALFLGAAIALFSPADIHAKGPVTISGKFEGILSGKQTVRLENGIAIKLGNRDAAMVAYDPGTNYFKIIGVTGSPAAKIPGKIGAKRWLGPGAMIFGNGEADSIPQPVTVHLPTLVATSPALKKFLQNPSSGVFVIRASEEVAANSPGGVTFWSSQDLRMLPEDSADLRSSDGILPSDFGEYDMVSEFSPADSPPPEGGNAASGEASQNRRSPVPIKDLIKVSRRQNEAIGSGEILGTPLFLQGPGNKLKMGTPQADTFLSDILEIIESLPTIRIPESGIDFDAQLVTRVFPVGDLATPQIPLGGSSNSEDGTTNPETNLQSGWKPYRDYEDNLDRSYLGIPTDMNPIELVLFEDEVEVEPDVGFNMGNALRRVLLSSLEGFGVTTVRIPGIEHEFSADANSTPDRYRSDLGVADSFGTGGRFPSGVSHTPSVDLFAVEHTNRDRMPGSRFGNSFGGGGVRGLESVTLENEEAIAARFVVSPFGNTGAGLVNPPPPNGGANSGVGGSSSSPVLGPGPVAPNFRIDPTSIIGINDIQTPGFPVIPATNLGFFRTYEANGGLLVTGTVNDFTNAGAAYSSLLFQSTGNLVIDGATIDTTNATPVPITPGIGFQSTGGNLNVVNSTINAPNNVGILLDNRSGGTLTVESSQLNSNRAVTIANQLDINNQPTNGTVTLSGVDIDAPQQVTIQSGGDLNITNNGAATDIDGNTIIAQSFNGSVSIRNSSQLAALTDAIFQASANGDVTVENSMLQAGNQLLIEAIRPNNPTLDLNGATLSANVIRARALGNGARVLVNNANITALTQLNLFADGANSLLQFSGNTTLTSPLLNLAGQKVQVDNGATVTTSTNPNVFTDQPNYNAPGFGSFSLPPNTQPYAGRPAF